MRRTTNADATRADLRAAAGSEDGIALILSVIVMLVLTITVAGTITAVTANEHAFGRDRQTNRALNIAEGGLNAGLAAVKALPATATSLSPASGTTDNGSWSYSVTRAQDSTNPDLYYWTITSTGVSPDGNVSRIVSNQIAETVTHNSTTTTTPVSPVLRVWLLPRRSRLGLRHARRREFVRWERHLEREYLRQRVALRPGQRSHARANGLLRHAHPLRRKEVQLLGNPPTIGTSAAKINLATVVGGCIDKSNHAVTCSSSANSHIYANNYSSTQADQSKPTIDTAWYTNAKPGPTTGCNNDPTHPGNTAYMSSYPSGYDATTFKNAVFDNDAVRNTSLGTVDLLSFGRFDCRYYASDGTLVGRLAWTPGSPGALQIAGTVFIDGNLTASGTEYAVYQGRGNIYVNGTVSFSGQANICATPSSGSPCQGVYAPNSNLLELVAVNAGNAPSSFSLTGQETFEGVAFMNGVFNEAGNGSIHGAVIADTASVAGNGSVPNGIIPPDGAPGAAGTTSTSGPDTAAFADVPGSWKQLK